MQAGKQLEHLSGGLVKAGFHEVVINEATLQVSFPGNILVHDSSSPMQAVERRKTSSPDRPLIRISSTFFWHLSSDFDLTPIPALVERAKQSKAAVVNLGKPEEEEAQYEPMKVGQQVQKYVDT